MNGLIVANGSIKDKKFYSKIIKQSNVVIAADGGADNCIRLGIIPDHVIGDFDSISDKAKKKFSKILIHNIDQNTTDMEKSIELAKKLKIKNLTIIGAIGTRLDHTLSNIISLSKLKIPCKIIDENNEIYLVEDEIELIGKKDDFVSVIPISRVEGLNYSGLKWNVNGKNVETGWLGTSNKMISNKATIKLKFGKIIVIKSKD